MKKELKTFSYNGKNFIEYKKFRKNQSFSEISKHLKSDRVLKFSTYEWVNGWSHEEFYKASFDSEYDIFKCVENGILYVPCENELFIYQ